ncbi:MAG: hypothetical protein PVG14_13490 [Anaerolineales bacterium]|jgi:uncharacterized Tic20 family protein
MKEIETIQKTDRVEGVNNQAKEYWLRILQVVLIVLSILVMVAFWGTFVYAIVIENVKLLTVFGQIIGVMVGVVVPVLMLQKLYQHVTKE